MEAPAKLTGKASARKRGRDAVVEDLDGCDTGDQNIGGRPVRDIGDNLVALESLRTFWRSLFNAQANGGFVELPKGVKVLGSRTRSSFFVRECYGQLLDVICDERYNEEANRVGVAWSSKWVITGNPGIGKTYFAAYLMWRLARQGATVVYEPAKIGNIAQGSTRRYLLRPDGTVDVCAEGLEGFTAELDDPATWFIVDAHCAENTYAARTVIVTSPRHAVYHEFLKGTDCHKRFMPVWTLDELMACRERLYSDLTEKRVANTYMMWGGIPREVLQRGSDIYDEDRGVDMEEALNKCDLSTVHNSIGEITNNEDISHRVLHIHLEEGNFTSPVMLFASTEVASRVCDKLLEENRRALIDYIYASDGLMADATCRRMFYEGLVHNVLKNGGTFTARNLETGEEEQVTLAHYKLSRFGFLADIRLKKPRYYIPASSNFPAVDSFTFEGFFQATIALKHPIKAHRLEELMVKLGDASPSNFYFVVPSSAYPDFKKQRFLTEAGRAYKTNIPENVRRITQYALKVDLA